MKKFVPLLALVLAGCSQATPTGTTWQVTELYDGSDTPSSLTDTVAGTVLFTFGASTINGETGCSQFQAHTQYIEGESISDAAELEITDIAFDPITEDCTGQARYTHETLVDILQPGTYEIRHDASDFVTLLQPDTAADFQPVGVALVSETPRDDA